MLSRTRGIVAVAAGAACAWAALVWWVTNQAPEISTNQTIFLVLLLSAVWLSTALSFYALSYRFFSSKRYQGSVAHALVLGLPLAFLIGGAAWLRLNHILTLVAAVFMVAMAALLQFVLLPKETVGTQPTARQE